MKNIYFKCMAVTFLCGIFFDSYTAKTALKEFVAPAEQSSKYSQLMEMFQKFKLFIATNKNVDPKVYNHCIDKLELLCNATNEASLPTYDQQYEAFKSKLEKFITTETSVADE